VFKIYKILLILITQKFRFQLLILITYLTEK